jgi:hypothetical protein
MNSRPCPSNASPTGRKQPAGHALLLALRRMNVWLALLFGGAMGRPAAKATAKSA